MSDRIYKKYVNAKDAAKHFKVSTQTVRKWAKEGVITTEKLPSGRYKYILDIHIHQENQPDQKDSKKIVYARVSSKKQKQDLESQINFLVNKYPTYTIISDVGSGINFERKGFKTILESVMSGNIEHVVVSYSDRWSRFGFEFFQWLFSRFNARLESISRSDIRLEEQNLTEDLMEVLTVFTARYYGRRKYKGRENKNKTQERTGERIEDDLEEEKGDTP